MRNSDFAIYNLKYFTKEEIEETGAKLGHISTGLIICLNNVRRILGVPIHLMHNGLTTGEHSSALHKRGMACDFAVEGVTVDDVFKAVLKAHFRGFGAYWNGVAHSFHVDLRPDYGFWSATKDEDGWKYYGLIKDPKNI